MPNKNDTRKTLGARIKQLRVAAKLTQIALAQRCGIFRTYLGQIESGLANPTLLILLDIAESLNVEITELFLPHCDPA
jgi:transcriptional regulator with XRE-family HTH domain